MRNKLLFLLILPFLTSCDEPEYKWFEEGEIRTLRIDDDSQYHFSTDDIVESDVSRFEISIERGNYSTPILLRKYQRCPDGKTCNSATNEWRVIHYKWTIKLPNDYKIETFDD